MTLTVEVKSRGLGPCASPKPTPPRTSLRNTPSIESITSETATPEQQQQQDAAATAPPENPPSRPPSSEEEEEREKLSSSFVLSPAAPLSTCNDASRFTAFTPITPLPVRSALVTDGAELTATAVGTVALPIGGRRPRRRLTIRDVLFVPLSPVHGVIAGEALWGEKRGVWPGGRLVRADGGKWGKGGGGGRGEVGVVVDREGKRRAWFKVVDG